MRLTYLTLSNSVGKAVRIFKMATFITSCYKRFTGRNCNRLKTFLQGESLFLNHARNNHMFRYLGKKKTHENENEYAFEVSKDPKEWEFVERLMPLVTVPVPKPKPNFPSGWRPPTEEGLKQPYYVERSRNHMLSVYLKNYIRGNRKVTIIRRISGDIWKLHNELKAHIEEQLSKKIATTVHESNNSIYFKGDLVYYIEQWLLSKGF